VLHQINYSHESVFVDRDCGLLDVQIARHYINLHMIYNETKKYNIPSI
jgi:hypothetical protein